MSGETNLAVLLAELKPRLNEGQYVFCSINDSRPIDAGEVLCTFREKEGVTVILKKEIAENLPAIKADPEKATWVLNNFLTNAIKYTPENGEIIIKAVLNKEYLEIGVQDFGTGIETGFQSKIFDRYFKVPNTGVKKGTGLGLAISKDFTEAMGGTIGISSEIGKGSYFFFRLLIG